MFDFIRSVRMDRIGLLLAVCFLSGVPNFAHCQSGTNYTIPAQVLDGGGGVCGSDQYRLTFSIGPAMGAGISRDSRRNLSPGFIAGVAGLREAGDWTESEDETGSGDETESDESETTDDGADTGDGAEAGDENEPGDENGPGDGSGTGGGSSSGGGCFISILF